ncbi:MAG: trypsin-like serine protease [Arcobacteraceae bacterium]|nr:trypsin-like serine protease [Arcobacteraceae bacterium]
MRYILFFYFFCSVLYANLQLADEEFTKGNYTKAIEYYEQLPKQDKYINKKLFQSYILAADHFSYVYNFEESKKYYNKAMPYNEKLVKSKLAKLYEKEGNLYNKGRKYNLALQSYTKAVAFGTTELEKKIVDIKKILQHQKNLKNDTRKVVNQNSPIWTKAIGRLVIPTRIKMATNSGYKVDIKKCSATLVNFEELHSSKIIVTASHCLTKFDKSVGLLRFLIKSKENKIIQKYATIYKDSNFDPKLKKASDFAILILSSPISKEEVEPVKVVEKSFNKLQEEYKYHFASLAGFSSDIGDFGSQLTYDPKCKIQYFNKLYGKSSCSGFKGASGGPVVLTTSKDKKTIEYYFVGIISHFRGNKYNKIYFAPHHIFYQSLKKAIEIYNNKE